MSLEKGVGHRIRNRSPTNHRDSPLPKGVDQGWAECSFMNNSRCPFVHSFPRTSGMRLRNLEVGVDHPFRSYAV